MARAVQLARRMRNASLLILLLAACAADPSADTRDDRGPGGGKADGATGPHFATSWSITSTAGAPTGCPAGFDTIAFYSQPLDGAGHADGVPTIDLFDCASGSGDTSPLIAGSYQVWVEIANHDNTQVYAKSTSASVTLADEESVSFNILTDGGYFAFSWDLIGGTSNQPLDCTGINGIESVATSFANSSQAIDDIFNCADHRGMTAGLLAGTYTVSFDALDSQDAALGVAPALANKTIEARNQVTELGHVTIPIDGR